MIFVVSIVAFFVTPFLLRKIFPDLISDPAFGDLVMLSRLLILSPLFLGLSNLLSSITQMYNRFFIYALSPLVYNVGIIIGIVFFAPYHGLMGLGYGVALGAFLHFFIQVPFVVGRNLFPRITLKLRFSDIWQVVRTSLPRTLALSSNEIAEFCFIIFASFLGVGSVSIFNFSWNLQSVPLSIIGVSYSLAVFPTLTRLHSSGNTKEFIQKIIISTKHIIFLSMPAAMLFIILRAQVVRTILGSGKFDWSDTRLTAAALALFTFSLIPQCLILLFVRAYYSSGATKKPVLINILSSGLTILLGYIFVQFSHLFPAVRGGIETLLRVHDIPNTEVLVLPLAYTIGVTINMLIHWISFEKDFGAFTKHVSKSIFQVTSASIVLGIVSYTMLQILAPFLDQETFTGIFLQGLIAGLSGIAAGVLVLMSLGSQELKDMTTTLKHRIWKSTPLSPVSSDPAMSEIS